MNLRGILATGLLAAPLAAPLALAACADDSGGLEWAALEDTSVPVAAPIELAVTLQTDTPRALDFLVDDALVGTCDPSAADEDCQLGDMWRWTITLPTLGDHVVTARLHDDPSASITLHLTAVVDEPERLDVTEDLRDEDVDELSTGTPTTTSLATTNRGFLDPARAFHNIFGGIHWKVTHQKVVLHTGTPMGSVSAVASCMHRYGASIRHWADHYHMSRGSVVATAITESGCTNPAGSSDGLSSGPMQVTASTCASLMGLSRSTCRVRMHTHPDFSFQVGVKYMASSFQKNQHKHDPPKIAAAYNAGSLRKTTHNRWHLLTTGNHIDRFVRAYNAYRKWESQTGLARVLPEPTFEGLNVDSVKALPTNAPEGEMIFVGNFAARDGVFYQRVDGGWMSLDEGDDAAD